MQLDDTSWGEFCDAGKRKAYAERGFDLDSIAKKYVEMINLALEAKPADMVITMHICREAEKFVPLGQLCLSPQCVFSSTEEGNLLTEEDQWAKLRLIRRIAERVWEDA